MAASGNFSGVQGKASLCQEVDVRLFSEFFDKVATFESKAARTFEGPFLHGPIRPRELQAGVCSAMGNHAVLDHGGVLAPNLYTVRLHPADYQQLSAFRGVLHSQLQYDLMAYANDHKYRLNSRPLVLIERADEVPRGMPQITALHADRSVIAERLALPQATPPGRRAIVPAEQTRDQAAVQRVSVSSAPRFAVLETMDADGAPRAYPLRNDKTVIGRHSTSDVRILDLKVSRLHAVISRMDDAYLLSDLESLVGTCLNGEPLTVPTLLHSHDQIAIAGHMFTFHDVS